VRKITPTHNQCPPLDLKKDVYYEPSLVYNDITIYAKNEDMEKWKKFIVEAD
jgi:hypothetical protein